MTRPPVRGDNGWSNEDADRPDDGDDDWPDDAEDLGDAGDLDDAEFEELRPPSSTARRLGIVAIVLLALFAVTVGGAGLFLRSKLDPGGAPGAEVRFTVPTGSSANAVATLLEDEGIIEDSQAFRLYLRFKGVDGFLAGDYVLQENMAAWEAVAGLSVPPLPADTVRFTVPEGVTLAEIPANIVDDIPGFDPAGLQALLASGTIRPVALPAEATTLEGYLFPDTYEIITSGGEQAALARMAQQFDTVATEIGLTDRAAAIGRTPYEIVVIASLIQEEYGIVEEMGQISRVIYNRLEIDMALQIDATSRYEAVLAGRSRDDIDFESDSAYNTRISVGLPPTPIALPGRAALEAALAPADGPWLYYVRDPDLSRTPENGHFFTDDYDEFLDVKAECAAADLGCD